MAGPAHTQRLISLTAALVLGASAVCADTLRVAAFNASLSRSAPGLLFGELTDTKPDPQIDAVIAVITEVRPDILLIGEFDHDAGGEALAAFSARLAKAGHGMPHSFAPPSNTGAPSTVDLNGDGRDTGPEDAFGFGRFPGQYAMALLSRHPIDAADARTFRTLRWADFPGALLPQRPDGAPWLSEAATEVFRLSSKSHWDVPIKTPAGRLSIYASHPTPPVFDGPEDLNGRRNHDEIAFWTAYLDGVAFPDDTGRTAARSDTPFVILGDLNADPQDGDGLREGIGTLLAHPAVIDTGPRSPGGLAAAGQGGANTRHRGDPAMDTADWRDKGGPGNLRVDYALPSSGLTVLASGVFWPEPGTPFSAAAAEASDHRLVWVDVQLPD